MNIILLDRIQNGEQFEKVFPDAKRKIIPTKNGKNVQVNEGNEHITKYVDYTSYSKEIS